MKKIMIFIFVCILIATQAGYTQNFKPLPIPSFESPVNGQSVFQENNPSSKSNTDAKRKIYVKVSGQRSADSLVCEATVLTIPDKVGHSFRSKVGHSFRSKVGQ